MDCTSSDEVANLYAGWLERGIHVVTPNKKAFSGNIAYYDKIQSAARAGGSHVFYETTVGAALPVIKALRTGEQTGAVA